MPGQMVETILGSQRALVDSVTLVNAASFPLTAMARKGPLFDNLHVEWPVDKFEDAEDEAVVDGSDVTDFDNAAKDYALLEGRMQWFRDSAMVSKLSQDVQNQAGVKDKIAYAVRKKLEKLWRDMEAAFCSDNEAQIGSGGAANKTRGLGKWFASTAQSVYPVPAAYLTPAANNHTGTIAQLTETVVQGLLAALWDQTDNADQTYTLLCGRTLKAAFTDFTKTNAGTTNVQAVLRVYNQDAASRAIVSTVDRFEGDFGKLELLPTKWNAKFTSSAANLRRGYLFKQDNLQISYKQMPKVVRLPDAGGGPRFYVDAIALLMVTNPMQGGEITSTT